MNFATSNLRVVLKEPSSVFVARTPEPRPRLEEFAEARKKVVDRIAVDPVDNPNEPRLHSNGKYWVEFGEFVRLRRLQLGMMNAIGRATLVPPAADGHTPIETDRRNPP